ncbi:hypothetical protein GWI33_022231 [Rhynchophorus ferrugineus]|uniref:Uncharacterized protein n=1 Tax=Rhynchophorus ferrugineus TaxID=354439 RepID=A0A834I0H8_RHYFE|nr:hypothetical protein GWI33_022235 [Rhynchophorus ferrugineus]KAF7264826.1 hypothetical protein GWI33_022231 [Rhynchophorus ferrugineus]
MRRKRLRRKDARFRKTARKTYPSSSPAENPKANCDFSFSSTCPTGPIPIATPPRPAPPFSRNGSHQLPPGGGHVRDDRAAEVVAAAAATSAIFSGIENKSRPLADTFFM